MAALPKSVQKVVLVAADGTAVTVYRRKKRKKRKGTPMLGPAETTARRAAAAATTTAETYLEAHDDANRDERDGWLVQLGPNAFRATSKGLRRLARGVRRE